MGETGENGTERLMSRWNAATQRWMGGRELLRELEKHRVCEPCLAHARSHAKALEVEMDRAEAVYFAALKSGRKVA
jgi:hypothetical protein